MNCGRFLPSLRDSSKLERPAGAEAPAYCPVVPAEGVPKVFSNRWCSGNSVKKMEVLDFDLLPRGFSVIWEDANSDHWHFGSAGVPLSLHP